MLPVQDNRRQVKRVDALPRADCDGGEPDLARGLEVVSLHLDVDGSRHPAQNGSQHQDAAQDDRKKGDQNPECMISALLYCDQLLEHTSNTDQKNSSYL